tara:strand:- start:233 stop:418 length:186 start_codon:yes stop_codon:yes gene_type:complete
MKKLLKLNPEYLIGIGIIISSINVLFFYVSSDIGFGIILLGILSLLLVVVLSLNQRISRWI